MKKGSIGVAALLAGAVAGAIGTGTLASTKINEKQQYVDKHLALFLLMNQWVKVKQEGKNLSSYFTSNNYHRIAIYGMSYVGETLVKELEGTGVEVAYGIDKNAGGIYADIDIVSVEEQLEDVDAIVVTAITFFDEIEETLSKKVSCPIVSLEDILYEI